MVRAWESQENKSEIPEMNAIHAVMMAQAAARYKDEVKDDAKAMGLEDDEKTVRMLESKTRSVQEILNNTTKVQAEEDSAADVKTESGESGCKDKIGFRDRKIIEYENRIRQYSAPDKEAFFNS